MARLGKARDESEEAPRTVRMRDVAERAGVGTMTVSRVLNGTARVSEDASERVYKAIKELQYRPNQLARALRGSRSHTIGVLLPYLYDPFFATCAHAISTVAQQHDYSVVLTTTNEDPVRELEEALQMMRRQVDGLILIPAEGSGMLSSPEFRGLPIVTLDRPTPRTRFDSVLCENKNSGKAATQHLIDHGHRRILFLGLSRDLYTIRMRLEGYEAAMERAGLEPRESFACSTEDMVQARLAEFLRGPDPITAIFTSNGLTTRFALQALTQLGVRVPQQVAIVGFDDFELADCMSPPLTVMRQPIQDLGRTAAELLFERFKTDGAKRPQRKLVLPVELVVRGSCGCPPSGSGGPTGNARNPNPAP